MSDKIYIADKTTLDLINTSIGKTSDTGGSGTNGSVMAKLNSLHTWVSSINTNVNNVNSNVLKLKDVQNIKSITIPVNSYVSNSSGGFVPKTYSSDKDFKLLDISSLTSTGITASSKDWYCFNTIVSLNQFVKESSVKAIYTTVTKQDNGYSESSTSGTNYLATVRQGSQMNFAFVKPVILANESIGLNFMVESNTKITGLYCGFLLTVVYIIL